MNVFKLLVGGAALGVILIAFRDLDRGEWRLPALLPDHGDSGTDGVAEIDAEPVLGYDGMDVDTLLAWLDDAAPDEATIRRMYRYERAGRARPGVLDALAARLG